MTTSRPDSGDRPDPPTISALRWLLRFAAAFLLLNTLLSFETRWPGIALQWAPRLSFELCLAVMALMGHVAWRGQLTARAASALAAVFMLLVLLRYIDVIGPAVFGRPVNLYWDGRHAADVLELALQSAPWWRSAASAVAIALGLFVLYRLVRWALATLSICLASRAPRPVLLAAGLALTLSFAAFTPERNTRWFFSMPISPTIAHQAVLLPMVLWPERRDAELPASPAFAGNVNRLQGADVLVVFAESYGATTLDNPAQAEALKPSRERFAQAIRDSGRGVVSARVRSPTFGGGSWLAHAALLSGVDTENPFHNDLLLTSHRPTLVSHFAQHGYRTVAWMPGLQKPWPEGTFYGFDRLAGANAIGYAGAPFGYWRIPDQATISLLQAQELAATNDGAARAPRFVVFPTLNTHAPFRPLPPYLDDWSRLTRPDAYTPEQQSAALAAPVSWLDAVPAYVESLRYQFDWLDGYLTRLAPRHALLIVIGDHQPLAAVSGRNASWDVPVHVISDDPALLQQFIARGFVDGVLPPPATLTSMHGLTRVLLDVFDAPGPPGPPDSQVKRRAGANAG